MAIPKFTEGTLYIDRDKDVRNESWGPYVKIGIVRDGKTPEQRVRELQTGNPRKVHTIKEYNSVPMVESLETRIHHNFADRWVRGEWFEMDDDFVENELDREIVSYISEQKEFLVFHKKRVELKSLPSNQTIREPTSDELKLHQEYINVKIRNDELKAKSLIVQAQMMVEMGNAGGINSILKLTKRNTPEKVVPAKITFDKSKFKVEYPELYDELIVVEEGTIKGNLTMKNIPTLAKVDLELKKNEETSKETCKNLKNSLCDNDKVPPSEKLKKLHLQYISMLGELFNTDLQMERIKSQFASSLGEDEGIEDIIQWKRASKPLEKFDVKLVETQYPEIYNDCSIEVPEKITPASRVVAIEVEMYREYVL